MTTYKWHTWNIIWSHLWMVLDRHNTQIRCLLISYNLQNDAAFHWWLSLQISRRRYQSPRVIFIVHETENCSSVSLTSQKLWSQMVPLHSNYIVRSQMVGVLIFYNAECFKSGQKGKWRNTNISCRFLCFKRLTQFSSNSANEDGHDIEFHGNTCDPPVATGSHVNVTYIANTHKSHFETQI